MSDKKTTTTKKKKSNSGQFKKGNPVGSETRFKKQRISTAKNTAICFYSFLLFLSLPSFTRNFTTRTATLPERHRK